MKDSLFKLFTIMSSFFKIVLIPKIGPLIRCKRVYLPLSTMLMALSMGLCPINHQNIAHHWIKTCHHRIAIPENPLPFAQHCALLQQHHRNCFMPLRSRGLCDPFSEMTMIKSLDTISSGAL